MESFELVEELFCGANSSGLRVLKALPDALFGVGLHRKFEQTLVGLSILHHGRSLPIHREHHGALALLQMLDEFAGRTAKGGEGLDVGGDVEHVASAPSTLFGAVRIAHLAKGRNGEVAVARVPEPEAGRPSVVDPNWLIILAKADLFSIGKNLEG